MCDHISDVNSYCLKLRYGKINVYDKIVIENQSE